MGDLVDIINAIADSVIVMPDGTAVKCYRLNEAKSAVSGGHLPVRIILPPGADGNNAVEGFEYVSYGRAQVTWRVTELMLWSAVASKGAVRNVWGQLVEYIDAYVSHFAARSLRNPTGGSLITGFQPQAAVLEYPQGSGNEYHGVQMTLLVTETIC